MRAPGTARAAALFLVLAAVTLAAGGATGYDRALELYREERFAEAAGILEAALAAGEADAAHLALLGWCRLRRGDVPAAREAFARATELDPRNGEGWSGLGHAALRSGEPAEAETSFRRALELAPRSVEARKGLALALRDEGRWAAARDAARRALELAPGDPEARALSERLRAVVLEERRPRPPVARGTPLRVPVRAAHARFELATGPLFVRGINLSTALPGRFPAQFPDDEALYLRWFEQMGDLGVNAVRLYTLHPPSLYRALERHNAAHPERRLWLIQGVWAETPPGDDFDDPAFVDALRAEVRRVIDAVHGNLELPARPGHAHGIYDVDVAEHLLAFVIGREWEPFVIRAWQARHPGSRRHEGRYVRTGDVQPIEAWLASILDCAAAHESEYYGWQHPLAFTSWPTLDPLEHPTEATFAEEMAARGRLEEFGDAVNRAFDDDLVQVDPTVLHAGAAWRAGLFAAYHVYPYHPDFMILDPRLARARDAEGPSRYLGYLLDLARRHGTMPVLVAEYGVPTSRGVSHLHPDGLHHGGHTSLEQGRIDARLLGDIERAGMAGGVLFSWIDEWFKSNWLTAEFESPAERAPLWLDMLDPEEQYGLIAARPGEEGWRVVLDGGAADWSGVPPLYPAREEGVLRGFRVTSDEAFLYLRIDLDPAAGREAGRGSEIWVGVDTYDAARGDHVFPAPAGLSSPAGMEFLLRFAGKAGGRILVDRPYDPFPERAGRPCRSVDNRDGDFVAIVPETNRERIGRDGTRFPARHHDRSRLRHGSTDPASPEYDELADWFLAPDGSCIEARIPWGLLNVADPSSRRVIHEEKAGQGPVGTRVTQGFRFHVLALRGAEGRRRPVDALPRLEPRGVEEFPLYTWPTWDEPTFHLVPKQSYFLLQRAWAGGAAGEAL